MNLIDKITSKQLNPNIPEFRVGDTVTVGVKITEGNKTRTQNFTGVVIARKNGGISETFTVRKKSSGIGVEMTLPVHSPKIEKITVDRKGKVRRAKIGGYMRSKIGQVKIKERN